MNFDLSAEIKSICDGFNHMYGIKPMVRLNDVLSDLRVRSAKPEQGGVLKQIEEKEYVD